MHLTPQQEKDRREALESLIEDVDMLDSPVDALFALDNILMAVEEDDYVPSGECGRFAMDYLRSVAQRTDRLNA